MTIDFSLGEWPQADITASVREFAEVASRVAELARSGNGVASFPASADRGLSSLVVRISDGPAVVAAVDGKLTVSGGPDAIELFGRNMPDDPSLPSGYHIHFEHGGREWFVSAASLPLIMTVGDPSGDVQAL